MSVYFVTWLDGAGAELDRLARGPGPEIIARFEGALLEGYTITEHRVHVITGELLASGHPQSHHDASSWSGEIDYARDPGIFELARGNRPTKYHREGGHYFFGDPPFGGGPTFERGVRQAFWDWVTDYKGGKAPSGGLPPESGGD